MTDIVAAILAKAAVMALEALLARLFVQLLQLTRYRLVPATA
ncbi:MULTISPECIES: hypothetical protein [Thermomonospora]|uniref:Uncharacterized protein n=1 Tax=Thermomonospora cellulosilytica TaxID=1411118 RepID=A0A7W3MZ16_9ACTN|nr:MULTISPECIES: hypothetical protein [Thermomonospora]MBA9004447.1 hypothetical protein [Thermomonospora cellulosilytica]